MAEGSEQDERHADPPARTEWFGRALGVEWVEIEPGIYEHRPIRTTESPETASGDEPLDEELRRRLPERPEDSEAEPELGRRLGDRPA